MLGTAPAFAGGSGAEALISDGISYAASGSGTGLYVSLNCEYSTAVAGTAVPLLASVEGGGYTVQGESASCAAVPGTVNSWEAANLTSFNGLSNANLSSSQWPSPACPVQETFDSWPAAYSPVAIQVTTSGAASPAEVTASAGLSGQPYVLAGSAAAIPAAAAPASGGVPAPDSMIGGGGNAASRGLSSAVASAGDPVNPENGDFSQSSTDVKIPGFGPPLEFTRTYDSQLAEQQTQTATPGPMGYGWTDNWATSVSSTTAAVPADIYTLDGERLDTGKGAPALQAALNSPGSVYENSSGIYIAETSANEISEIPFATGSQWGISMTAGDIYTIAGSQYGQSGNSPAGTVAVNALLDAPQGLLVTAAGNLLIADSGNNRVLEVPAVTGGGMTADDIYSFAGHASGAAGHSGDGGAATLAFLADPVGLAQDRSADIYIADDGNNRVQEVFATGGESWGSMMTNGDIYTVAGNAGGTSGISPNGTPLATSHLNAPEGVGVDSGGSLYIADTGNNRIAEAPAAGGMQFGISMTANEIYDVAGSATGVSGSSPSGTVTTSSKLSGPTGVFPDNGKQLYISDAGNNRVEEVARTGHTEWGIVMAQNEIYTIAGSSTGSGGFSGDGGSGISATMRVPLAAAMDGSFNLYVADSRNNRIREVTASSGNIGTYAGTGAEIPQEGDSGPAATGALNSPQGEAFDTDGDVFIADFANNRVQEISASSHFQYGINMAPGDVYTVAGNSSGLSGITGDGALASDGFLSGPTDVAVDPGGNLYIVDSGNNRIQEVAASNGFMSTVAGSATGSPGFSGDGGAAASALLQDPESIAIDAQGDLYIADTINYRIREVFAAGGQSWGRGSSTPGDIYTIAGNGTSGHTGDGGPATSAEFAEALGVAVDGAGDVYVADLLNNRVQEVPVSNGIQHGQQMTKYDMYTIAGSAAGTQGMTGDGGLATSALLADPADVAVDAWGNVYVADALNNRIQEIPFASGTQWGQSMLANNMYTVTGSATGTSGDLGDGDPASGALMNSPNAISADAAGDLYVTDLNNNRLREVVATTTANIAADPGYGASVFYPIPGSTIAGVTYLGGTTITEPGGAEVTFWPKSGSCPAGYQAAGTAYCVLAQDEGATLTTVSGISYAFTPAPDDTTYTYNWTGQLTGESDTAGDALVVAPGTPAPGAGNCPALATSCETITSASGRALVLGFNVAGRVTSVTDPMGRRWAYAYTGAHLTSATAPVVGAASRVTSYTYGQGSTGNPLLNNDLLTITGPNAQPGGPDAGDATVNIYDSLGRVTSQTTPAGWQTTFSYCANAVAGDCMNDSTGTGFVTVTDPDGNTTAYGYTAGALTSQAVTSVTTVISETDQSPDVADGTLLPQWSTDGNGNVTTYGGYSPSGQPTQVTAPAGASTPDGAATTTTSYTTALEDESCDGTAEATGTGCQGLAGPAAVTPGGVITPPAAAPPEGVTYTLNDTDGNELYTTTGVYEPGASTAAYSQTSYTLYGGNSVTLAGHTISCAVSPPSASLPCATINPDGVVTQLGYDTSGDLTSTSTPDGNGTELAATTYGYDADGERTSQVSPDGNLTGANSGDYTTITAYDADSEVTSVTQGGGTGHSVTPRVTSYGYDADGNQTTVEDARSFTTTTTYSADDKAVLVTDPTSNAALTCYDGDGNTVQTVPPTGVAANSLTPASCPAAYPAGYSTRLAADATVSTYDGNGDQTQQTSPAPAGQTGFETTTYAYDGDGNVVKTTAPAATNGGPDQVTADAYDSAGNLASETTGAGTSAASTLSYCYDPNGDTTSVVYGDGNTTGTAQCPSASPWTISSGSQAAHQTTYSYDSASELISTTTPATSAAPSGATTTETYDAAGNTLTRTDPNGITTTWTYTPLSKTATVTYSGASAHSVTYGYDAGGNKTAMTDATGSSSYVYDPFSELTSATNGAGQVTGYGYNADGEVSSITYPLPATATWATSDTVTYGYNSHDVLNSVTDFNGNQIAITNNGNSLPSSVSLGSTGDSVSYTYDQASTPSAIVLKNPTTTLQSFTYSDSPAGTILSETDVPASSESPASYSYDSKGRVISMTPGTNPTLNYGFDASSNLTQLPTGATTTYDNAGELTSSTLAGTATSYAYNADGEQTGATQAGTTISSATWNGAGELTAYGDPSANMTAASYDGNGERASATTGTSTQSFVWSTVSSGTQMIMDSINAYVYAFDQAPAEQVNLATGTIVYLFADLLGSTRGVINSSGSLTGTTGYDAWGNPETVGGLSVSTPFGFAGGFTDPTGLIYLINRYYAPWIGQFESIDPLINQTLEPYGYAGENPISNNDPDGQSFQDWAFWSGINVAQGWIPTGALHVYFNGSGMYVNYFKAQFTSIRKLHHASIRVYITWHPYSRACGFSYTRNCYLLGEWGYWTGTNEGFVAGPHVTVPHHFDGAAVVFALYGWYDGHLIAKTVDEICKSKC
ncbi:MAG TPA: RHS repeat-associated core domain-containing protein [Streptosporangiaceae bacterium]|nr:RHS repeat-associated core domain-containing protein [Streptosporangiaceae bacterium]